MKPQGHDGSRKEHSDVDAVVQGNTAFALELYGKLKQAEGNLFCSPHSISTALAMTYGGARGNTETQMAQTLHFGLDQEHLHPAFASLEAHLGAIQAKGNVLLKVANALWPQMGYEFLKAYLALTKDYYGVLITPLDYSDPESARGKINAWVDEKTEGKITDLIPSGVLDALTRLVLVNAIYFKGNWASQFEEDRTRGAPFWVTPAEKINVPTMAQEQEFGYGESGSLQILELPYAGNDVSMIVLLPRRIDGLMELEEALTVDNLAEWTRSLSKEKVQVFLPRFRMSCSFSLNATLMSMGMIDAFGDGADFSGMDGRTGWLYIAAVLHKAFVDVNEEGTEAAAATAVVMKARSLPPPVPTFRADHPFLFLIRDNCTQSILFLGRVVDPRT